jgi:hypothetical protein
LAFSLAACKQERGDVCQIDRDCEDPLVCNASTQTCQRAGMEGEPTDALPPDAALPADAAPADAPLPDEADAAPEADAAAAM